LEHPAIDSEAIRATAAMDLDTHRARGDAVRRREPLRTFKDLPFTILIATRSQADVPLSQLRNLIRLVGRSGKGFSKRAGPIQSFEASADHHFPVAACNAG
jgi:hypothetical protein